MVEARLLKFSDGSAGSTTPDAITTRAKTKVMEVAVRNIQTLQYPNDSPAVTIALPEQDASENLTIKISGNEAECTISWRLGEDDTTPILFGGSGSDPISAVDVMMELREHFVATTINDSYQLWLPSGGSTDITQAPHVINGYVDSVAFTISEDAPEILIASVRLKETLVLTTIDIEDSSNQGDDTN